MGNKSSSLSLVEEIDKIATKFIITQNSDDIQKLFNKDHCDKLVILTAKVIGQNLDESDQKKLLERINPTPADFNANIKMDINIDKGMDNAKDINIDIEKAKDIDIEKAKDNNIDKAKDMDKAKDIDIDKAKDIEKAKDIDIDKAKDKGMDNIKLNEQLQQGG